MPVQSNSRFQPPKMVAGERVGRLVATGEFEARKIRSGGRIVRAWFGLFQCDCGAAKWIYVLSVSRGLTSSCGCLQAERCRDTCHKHGGAGTRIYSIWGGMVRRCHRSSHKAYAAYGGRGIHVCDEWRDNFPAFKQWAEANGYGDTLTIERVDVNRGYCPENCTWIPRPQQAKNTRQNRYLEAFGERKLVIDWISDPRCKTNRGSLRYRLLSGWSAEDALSAPSNHSPKACRYVTAFGETKRVIDWAEDHRCAVKAPTLGFRLRKGWDPEDAITRPVHDRTA
jgi:hypothetical protein